MVKMQNRKMAHQIEQKIWSIIGSLSATSLGNGFSVISVDGSTFVGFRILVDRKVNMKPPSPKPAFTRPVSKPSYPGINYQETYKCTIYVKPIINP